MVFPSSRENRNAADSAADFLYNISSKGILFPIGERGGRAAPGNLQAVFAMVFSFLRSTRNA